MKKNDWAILIGTAIYSGLFYEQNAGVNFLLFSLVVVALLMWIDLQRIRNKKWMLLAAATLFSAVCITVHGSWLAIFANIVSLLLLSAASISKGSSLFTDLISGTCSLGGSLILMIRDLFVSRSQENKIAVSRFGLITYISAFVIICLFFAMYQHANPLFKEFTKNINLDFISFNWICFTIGGLIIMCALIRHYRVDELDEWEQKQETAFSNDAASLVNPAEKKGLLLLFIVLNLMLLFINLLDVNFLYLGSGLPEGITHKQFVHQGVNMLVLSIIFGICIILFAFRRSLNFDVKNKTIKLLIYLWILQNILMVISTAFRNHLYITEALLTYKRIGVYYWLTMAALGLITTFIKVKEVKRNWYLIRKNTLFAIVLLILSSAIDWDQLISNYNITRVPHVKDLDKKYLLSLSEGNMKQLYQLRNHPEFERDTLYHYEYYRKYSNRKALDKKLYNFLLHNYENDWRSFNLRRSAVLNDIAHLDSAGTLDSLNLSLAYIKTLNPLKRLSRLQEVTFPSIFRLDSESVEELNSLTGLIKVSLLAMTIIEFSYVDKLRYVKNIHVINKTKELEQLISERKTGKIKID